MSESPPSKRSRSEQVLPQHEAAKLESIAAARSNAQQHQGVVMDSESVSYDPRFGHIFRYDVKNFAGSYKGDALKIQAVLVLHTTDGRTFVTATYPLIEMPVSTGLFQTE